MPLLRQRLAKIAVVIEIKNERCLKVAIAGDHAGRAGVDGFPADSVVRQEGSRQPHKLRQQPDERAFVERRQPDEHIAPAAQVIIAGADPQQRHQPDFRQLDKIGRLSREILLCLRGQPALLRFGAELPGLFQAGADNARLPLAQWRR